MAQDEIYAATERVLAILRDQRVSQADAMDVLRKCITAAYCKGREDGSRDTGERLMRLFLDKELPHETS